MDDFLLDCFFNAFYEGLKFRKLTPRYDNRLLSMLHSAESQLPAMLHSAESRLRAMRHSVELSKKNSSTTLRYATQHEIRSKISWSTLRFAAQRGVDSDAMRHSPESRLSAMLHSAELTQIRDISTKSKPNSKIF
jgi:hypothetical protein